MMNIAVFYFLCFAENMLNMPLVFFENGLSSVYRVIRFNIIFEGFFYFLVTSLHQFELFNLSSPQNQVILNKVHSGQTSSLCSNLDRAAML